MLLLVLGLSGAFAAAIVLGVVKAPRMTIAALALLTLAAVAGWKVMVHAHHLGHVPGALHVTRVLYVSEDAWGFGPGGNEAGFLAYALPRRIARQLETGGVAWLDRQDGRRRSPGWRGRFDDWRATPMQPHHRWRPDPASGRFDVLQYVCAYGFCIDIDPAQRAAVEEALHAPGSFYAFGRIGMILLVPRTRRVYFLYNG